MNANADSNPTGAPRQPRQPRQPRLRRAAKAALAGFGILAFVGAASPVLPADAAEPIGALNLNLRDSSIRPVTGACFNLYRDAGNGELGDEVKTGICDLNGVLQISQAAGTYVLVETIAPWNYIDDGGLHEKMYARLAPRKVEFTGGSVTTGTAVHASAGKLRVQARKPVYAVPGWAPLTGVCWNLRVQDYDRTIQGSFVTEDLACDGPDNDGWAEAVMIPSTVGVYGIAPTGWVAPTPTTTALPRVEEVAETFRYFTPATQTTILQEDESGHRVAGGCYSVFDNNEFFTNLCDQYDNANDGQVSTIELSGGSYRYEEYEAPHGYELAAPFTSSSRNITVKHTKRPWLSIVLTDPSGVPLNGACFAVPDPENAEAYLDEACDDEDGTIDGRSVLKVLPAGTFDLIQTVPVPGYNRTARTPFTLAQSDLTLSITNQSRETNRPPVAAADTATTDEDSVITGNVLANDSDPELKPLTAEILTGPSSGAAVLGTDGAFAYTPSINTNGVDSFTYKAIDEKGLFATATVNVTVRPVNDAPIAVVDSATTAAGHPVVIDVLANDNDIDSAIMTAVISAAAANGTVTIVPGGIGYAPNPGFSGADTFTYRASDGAAESLAVTVTVTVTAVSPPPPPVDDCTINGTPDGDVLVGTPGRDIICGLGGNDTIDGRGGDDIIRGGDGNDTISGGRGADVIDAGDGDDSVRGAAGDDIVNGNAGNDRLHGNAGNDDLRGGDGGDRLQGDAGSDALDGGNGDDRLFGGSGDDVLTGGGGDNRYNGGRGTDTVDGVAETVARRGSPSAARVAIDTDEDPEDED